jgi:hypothetical protein
VFVEETTFNKTVVCLSTDDYEMLDLYTHAPTHEPSYSPTKEPYKPHPTDYPTYYPTAEDIHTDEPTGPPHY